MAERRTEDLRDALRRLFKRAVANHGRPAPPAAGDARPSADLEPATAFEALLQQQMLALEQQLQDLRGRINDLFLLIVGTVALQAVLRIAGF